MNCKETGRAYEFDSAECAAAAHDLAVLQTADLDRAELNFSVKDLELIIEIAKGNFGFIADNRLS